MQGTCDQGRSQSNEKLSGTQMISMGGQRPQDNNFMPQHNNFIMMKFTGNVSSHGRDSRVPRAGQYLGGVPAVGPTSVS